MDSLAVERQEHFVYSARPDALMFDEVFATSMRASGCRIRLRLVIDNWVRIEATDLSGAATILRNWLRLIEADDAVLVFRLNTLHARIISSDR